MLSITGVGDEIDHRVLAGHCLRTSSGLRRSPATKRT